MVAAGFDKAAHIVRGAIEPEDAFGTLATEAHGRYRSLAIEIHPDRNGGADEANDAFTRLQRLWSLAEKKISDGSYGKSYGWIDGKRGRYEIGSRIGLGSICDVHNAWTDGEKLYVKIVRRPANNELIAREFSTVKRLAKESRMPVYYPSPYESVGVRMDGGVVRRAALYRGYEGFHTLTELMSLFPDGIHPKDGAWMWRRILIAIGLAHEVGLVHGAVLPDHILMHPTLHGIVLIDWKAAVAPGDRIQIVSKDHYPHMYPREVGDKETVGPETDIYMAARVMEGVLYGPTGAGRATTPTAIRAHLNACLMPKASNRPGDALETMASFTEIIERLWGRRRYRPFAWPT